MLLKPSSKEKRTENKSYEKADISTNYLESHFDTRLLENADIKTKLAKRAIEMIPEKGVVILDSGTSILQIAKFLNRKSDLVIITNSLIVAQVLENTSNQLMVTGGQLRKKSMSFVGSWASKAIESINADIAFISCNGFHKDGPCTTSYGELEVKDKILKNSKEVVLVCDSSKFNLGGLHRFATFDQITHLITDSNISKQQLELLPSNIKVSIV
jgi:DeoR/GlpR family transcriptional regulator of sugar metabolism